jgi:hypothetical protein
LYGVDAGLDPALVFGQRMADGQLRRLAEVVASSMGLGPSGSAKRSRSCWPTPRFAPFLVQGNIRGFGDPSAFHGHDKEDPDDAHWMSRFALAAGLTGEMRPKPAPTNLPCRASRRCATRWRSRRACRAACSIRCMCPTCGAPTTASIATASCGWSATERYDPEPEKNEASHIADADQYLALMEGGYAKAIGRDQATSSGNAVLELMQQRGLIAPSIGRPGDDRRRGPQQPLIIR